MGASPPKVLTLDVNVTDKDDRLPIALTFLVRNRFDEWPTWNYPTCYDVYCENNHTIVGEPHPYIGAFFILEYFIFLALNVPTLIVMARPDLLVHSCYKLMFFMGVLENVNTFISNIMAGIFAILGVSYCSHTRLLIVTGHAAHSFWYFYCYSIVILSFNRYLELKSPQLADRLFAGNRTWIWISVLAIYSALLSSSLDLPLLYNSMYSVFIFQIELQGPPVTNVFCILNCATTLVALVIIYTLLMVELHNKSKHISGGSALDVNREKLEKKVRLQCFLICFVLFIVLVFYTAINFVPIPLSMGLFATISVQMSQLLTSLVYLLFNKTIRDGVRDMLFPCLKGRSSTIVPTQLLPTKPLAMNNVSQSQEPIAADGMDVSRV